MKRMNSGAHQELCRGAEAGTEGALSAREQELGGASQGCAGWQGMVAFQAAETRMRSSLHFALKGEPRSQNLNCPRLSVLKSGVPASVGVQLSCSRDSRISQDRGRCTPVVHQGGYWCCAHPAS